MWPVPPQREHSSVSNFRFSLDISSSRTPGRLRIDQLGTSYATYCRNGSSASRQVSSPLAPPRRSQVTSSETAQSPQQREPRGQQPPSRADERPSQPGAPRE